MRRVREVPREMALAHARIDDSGAEGEQTKHASECLYGAGGAAPCLEASDWLFNEGASEERSEHSRQIRSDPDPSKLQIIHPMQISLRAIHARTRNDEFT